MTNQRGIALVIVLWGVALLSLLAAALAASSGMAAKRSLNMVEAAQARARLDEALAAAMLALGRAEHPWVPDGRRHRLVLDGADAEIRVTAESGRADLNHTAPELLRSLLERAASDGEAGDRLAGLLATRAAQRPLVTVTELAGLPGMTVPLFRRLLPLVTVHNPDGKIDWRLADPALLAAIPGLHDDQLAALMARRSESGYSPEPSMLEAMNHVGVGSSSEQGAAGGSKLLSVHMSLSLAGGGRASAEILIRLSADRDPFHIVEWRSPAGDGA
ncbi:MAG TPA: hypothetical protein VKP60_22195 [Magnetospirillaceae bacterium]|nr:hypothetical protein [Magnetospirillaceae bacterium]